MHSSVETSLANLFASWAPDDGVNERPAGLAFRFLGAIHVLVLRVVEGPTIRRATELAGHALRLREGAGSFLGPVNGHRVAAGFCEPVLCSGWARGVRVSDSVCGHEFLLEEREPAPVGTSPAWVKNETGSRLVLLSTRKGEVSASFLRQHYAEG